MKLWQINFQLFFIIYLLDFFICLLFFLKCWIRQISFIIFKQNFAVLHSILFTNNFNFYFFSELLNFLCLIHKFSLFIHQISWSFQSKTIFQIQTIKKVSKFFQQSLTEFFKNSQPYHTFFVSPSQQKQSTKSEL